MTPIDIDIDPRFDLVLERFVAVRPELVWKAWTTPSLLEQWFCPKPWFTTDCEIDLRPGGAFRCVRRGPAGEANPQDACWLEVIPNRRLVWTDTLRPGFRPASNPFITGIVLLEPEGDGTRYRAIARHADETLCKQHAELGFYDGWGTVTDQLVALMQS